MEVKSALFTKANRDVHEIYDMLMDFGKFSGFRINFAKSDIMPLTTHLLVVWRGEIPL